MEYNYQLLGVSGVEDLLQDNVQSCINDFMKADMKVWMLTGDKGATAKQIGYSCGILDREMNLLQVEPNAPIEGQLSGILNKLEKVEKTADGKSVFGEEDEKLEILSDQRTSQLTGHSF